MEQLLAERSAPIDPKVDCWISDPDEVYIRAKIVSAGDKCTVESPKGTTELPKAEVFDCNPSKFEKEEDMSNLSILNKACVLHNLRTRYKVLQIYTYSGLFCICINPYKWLMVYTPIMRAFYRNKRRNEAPPHLYAVADGALQLLEMENKHQSSLITGESGAGKTENTKKVLQYFALNCADPKAAKSKASQGANAGSLEEQIIQANPPLEAYGNAKTVRNNNSSRFGKFIRIHFGPTSKIASADIETYLLEKSRITFQLEIERNYHIFYQIMTDAYPHYWAMCALGDKPFPGDFFFIAQGVLTVAGMDDAEEMRATDTALDTLGFNQEQKNGLYKGTIAIAFLGNQKWKQKGREEQAEPDGQEHVGKCADLLGIEVDYFCDTFMKPKLKVGKDFVKKGQNVDQVNFSVSATSKSLFARMFDWVVALVNDSLDTPNPRKNFIGVLDIAGFEIFELNVLEQLLINYTNERLQQFFNHHMFVQEQEEYKAEGIQWAFVDFGMDLIVTIELIEKKMGILAMLEEECIVPKATDKTYLEKMMGKHLGKHKSFGKPKPAKKGKPEAHFEVHHYAGTVGYNVTGWLFKNKDPVNEAVIGMMSQAGNPVCALVFTEKDTGEKKKGSSMMTISAAHRESLMKLMTNLHSTHPHFVRCIIPNEIKKSGHIDAPLVMHQLNCNGVLEGIRICMLGLPNKVPHADFMVRYSIVAPKIFADLAGDPKECAQKALVHAGMDADSFRCGKTKIMFRAGMLSQLEEIREASLSKIIVKMQCQARRVLVHVAYDVKRKEKVALEVVQRNIKNYFGLKNWPWWLLYCELKPLLIQLRLKELYEGVCADLADAKAGLAKGEALKAELEEAQVKIYAERDEISGTLNAEREAGGDMEQKYQAALKAKSAAEEQLKEVEARLMDEEDANANMAAATKKLNAEGEELKKDIEDLERSLAKAEQEKNTKETQIKSLQDEMAQQDELIAKLTREKKKVEENNRKASDDLQAEEDKVNHLSKVKGKLESTLDELEDGLEREKKSRADLDKAKRKLETELKGSLAAVDDLERVKRDLEEATKRKDAEYGGLIAKYEDENSAVAGAEKKVKDAAARIEEIEEELEAERQARAKVEKQRSDLAKELDELTERLEDAGGATAAQAALNKTREGELLKLRRDLEEANIGHEGVAGALRKKHSDAVAEMGDQIDQLQKLKNNLEKEKQSLSRELLDLTQQHDGIVKGKAAAEKLSKQLELQLTDCNGKIEEHARLITELTSTKQRLQAENGDLLRQLEDAEHQIGALSKLKQQLGHQLEDTKRALEEESRAKTALASAFKNAQADLDSVKEQLEEEVESKGELHRSLSKATTEAQMWRTKYEQEGIARAEELEEAKRKLTAKLAEAEEQVEQALGKCSSLEKTKNRLACEVEDLMIDVERANANAAAMEKKQRQFDKLIADWKLKCEDITVELEASQKEARGYSTELFKLKTQYEESLEHIEGLKRENKVLADEIHDLTDQLGEGGKSVHELDKARRKLEMEKEELQAALEEAEAALEQEEAKVVRAQLELSQIRAEIDRRLAEKEEEFENTRKNHARALESMQGSLEAETKAKQEALRMKKKLEADINELEVSLDHANRANAEAMKTIKKYLGEIKELQTAVEDEQRAREEAREAYNMSERRCNMLTSELEEMRVALEASDRARKAAEGELHDAAGRIQELTGANAMLAGAKRKLEQDLQAMQTDMDDAITELKNTEEKAKKAAADAANLAEELRREQEHAVHVDRLRKQLEVTVKDLQARLDEAEAAALKGGKRIIAKLEARVRELETELDAEQRRHAETGKNLRKTDRRLKELAFQAEEDRKNMERMQDLVEKLQAKIKTYKRQVEEAEEIAAMNLAKYRKVQHEMEDAGERADVAEGSLAKVRAKNRSSASAPLEE